MAISMNSVWDFSSPTKLGHKARPSLTCNQHSKWCQSSQNSNFVEYPSKKSSLNDVRWHKPLFATESNKAATETSINDSKDLETAFGNDQLSSLNSQSTPMGNRIETPSPQTEKPTPKRPPLTAREKLRAARVLSKYNETKPVKQETSNRVLDALRESNKGKKRSGLPEAPSNLLDDSKRGTPKQGLTFNIPVGSDLLAIAFSFVFISTVMFATTYIVWKAGAIHFNEY